MDSHHRDVVYQRYYSFRTHVYAEHICLLICNFGQCLGGLLPTEVLSGPDGVGTIGSVQGRFSRVHQITTDAVPPDH